MDFFPGATTLLKTLHLLIFLFFMGTEYFQVYFFFQYDNFQGTTFIQGPTFFYLCQIFQRLRLFLGLE